QVQFALSEGVTQQVRTLVDTNAGKVVNDNMICSGRVRTMRDTCTGDNGGPLFSKSAHRQFTPRRLTTLGEGCRPSRQGLYGIYPRAARYGSWVQQTAK